MKAKTYAIDDIVVVVMRGSGFTALEQTHMDSGQPSRVVEMRGFQAMMAERYKRVTKALTGRNVVAFISQAHVQPDIRSRCSSSTGRSRGSARSKSSIRDHRQCFCHPGDRNELQREPGPQEPRWQAISSPHVLRTDRHVDVRREDSDQQRDRSRAGRLLGSGNQCQSAAERSRPRLPRG